MSYFPPPVRAVEIPKPHGGGVRVLGVPTVADRVAQTVVATVLEEAAEPRFHYDSYGYRPGKAAWDAIGTTRKRCWSFDWAIDLDVQRFFDTVPWDLVQKGNGTIFSRFLPAAVALKAKSADLRRMRIHRRTTLTLKDLARWLNPIVAGWMNYYGRFYRSALEPLLQRVNTYVRRWAGNKYTKLRSYTAVRTWWERIVKRDPRLFVQWRWVCSWA